MEEKKLKHLEKIRKLKKPWGSRYSKGWYVALALRVMMLVIFFASAVAYVFSKTTIFGWLSLAAGIITIIIVSSFFPSYDINELKELNGPNFDIVNFEGYHNVRIARTLIMAVIAGHYLTTSLMIAYANYCIPIGVNLFVFILLVIIDVAPRVVYPLEPLWWHFDTMNNCFDNDDCY